MAIDFAKLFKDKKAYADDLKITLGNGEEIELGVLRSYNDSQNGELVKSLQAQRNEVEAERKKIQKAGDEVARLYLDLEKQKSSLAAVQPQNPNSNRDPLDEAYDDPIAGLVAKELKKFKAEAASTQAKLEEQVNKLLKATGDMGLTYLNDRARMEYDALRADKDFPEDLSLESLYDYTIKRGYKEPNGIPQLKRGYEEYVQPKRLERLLKEAEDKGAKKAREEAKLNAVLPRPGAGNGAGFSTADLNSAAAKAKNAPKNLNEAIAAAAKDVDIWTGAASA